MFYTALTGYALAHKRIQNVVYLQQQKYASDHFLITLFLKNS